MNTAGSPYERGSPAVRTREMCHMRMAALPYAHAPLRYSYGKGSAFRRRSRRIRRGGHHIRTAAEPHSYGRITVLARQVAAFEREARCDQTNAPVFGVAAATPNRVAVSYQVAEPVTPTEQPRNRATQQPRKTPQPRNPVTQQPSNPPTRTYIFRTRISPPEERNTSFGPPPLTLPLSDESL